MVAMGRHLCIIYIIYDPNTNLCIFQRTIHVDYNASAGNISPHINKINLIYWARTTACGVKSAALMCPCGIDVFGGIIEANDKNQ